eukprot:scaffold219778_cov35-Attheya_sp.AAC.2
MLVHVSPLSSEWSTRHHPAVVFIGHPPFPFNSDFVASLDRTPRSWVSFKSAELCATRLLWRTLGGRAADISASTTKQHDDGRSNSRFSFGSFFGGLDGTWVACDRMESVLSLSHMPVSNVSEDFSRLKRSSIFDLDVLVVSPPQPRLGKNLAKQQSSVNHMSTAWMDLLRAPVDGPERRPPLVLVLQAVSFDSYFSGRK